ncbi:hypothetical protein [Enterovibrio paralichthyis]|uniref:hypothetical protein n=1 Tax=Enterovibrio paralichthyis TaxID=2853805 RepID=UPI001C487BF8|nr:hypothetical protein [Enterovibrio paralichthyis]MBV7300290.1 hypothetical protein [Enterovibrio paralichthyis]
MHYQIIQLCDLELSLMATSNLSDFIIEVIKSIKTINPEIGIGFYFGFCNGLLQNDILDDLLCSTAISSFFWG